MGTANTPTIAALGTRAAGVWAAVLACSVTSAPVVAIVVAIVARKGRYADY